MMKQIISCLLVLSCIVTMFAGCQKEPSDTQTTAPENETTAPPTLADLDITLPKETKPPVPTFPLNEDGLPEYVAGSIWLIKQETDDFNFERKYRLIYYTISQVFWEMLPDEQQEDFWEWSEKDSRNTNYGEFREEMWLVTMIKRYDVPREVFEQAVARQISLCEDNGWSYNTNEENEIPNVDIIYTFDNEIINNFYRYE